MLALEPEAAAIYAVHNTKEKLKEMSTGKHTVPSKYMVVDIGGGTVDVAVHHKAEDGVKVVLPPCGNAKGGTMINKAFEKLLKDKILLDPDLYHYYKSSSNQLKQKSIINDLVYQEFEEEKYKFGHKYGIFRRNDSIAVDIPPEVLTVYSGDKIKRNIAISHLKGVTFEESTLYFTPAAAEEYLFQKTMEGIITCIMQALEKIDYDITAIYLVGGFGGCQYVYSKVEEAIKLKTNKHQQPLTLFQLEFPHLAVINGAVLWHKYPNFIKARVIDATYGILINIAYDPKYNPIHKSYIDDDGIQHMTVFCSFVKKGELLPSDEVISTKVIPARHKSTSIRPVFCSGDESEIQFPKNNDGKATVAEIGNVIVDIPNPNCLKRHERKVEVTMDFSGTEIQAKAKYLVDDSEVKIVCDFLSQIKDKV